MQSTHRELCDKLKQLRQHKKVSQSTIDKALGWKPHTYGKLERGGRAISVARINSLCAYFNISKVEIFGHTDTQTGYDELPAATVLRQLCTTEAYKVLTHATGLDAAALVAKGYRFSFDSARKGTKGRIIISW